MTQPEETGQRLASLARLLMLLAAALVLVVVVVVTQVYWPVGPPAPVVVDDEATEGPPPPGSYHRPGSPAPDTALIPRTAAGQQIRYGRELVAHTARYLGPKGLVGTYTNGLNCQNCHLQAGTQGFANNYLSVAATYPKLRARSGSVEGIEKRVADCMERSLNGRAVPDSSREMRAIVAYIQWLGQGTPKGKKVHGTGFMKLPYLDRPADPQMGRIRWQVPKLPRPRGPGQEAGRRPRAPVPAALGAR